MVGFSLLLLLLCVVVVVFPSSASPSPPLEQAALGPIEFPAKTSGSDTGARMALGAHNVECVGQIRGVTYAVALRGNYAYIGVGPCLVILDVSIRAHPTFVGQTGVLPDLVRGVAAGGNYAYVADGSSGLRIVEVSDPSNPTQVGTHDTPGVRPWRGGGRRLRLGRRRGLVWSACRGCLRSDRPDRGGLL